MPAERHRDVMDDNALVAAVAGGDDAALRELFGRHARWLAARLRAVLPAPDVEDVLQETFLAVWRGAGRYQPVRAEGAAAAWLWGIARRQAAQCVRRHGPAATAGLESGGPVSPDHAAAADFRVDLDRAVAALGEPGDLEREVWRLMYVEDRSVAEVAAAMGVPEGTVKSRAHRVRRRLRQALGGRPMEGGAR